VAIAETLLATLTAGTRKKWLNNELSLGADGTYGETTINGVNTKNAESIYGFVQYNHLFTERWYGYGRVEGFHDGIADIKYRAILGVGAGYYFIKTKTTDLSLEVGPGYVFQQLGDETKHYATLRVGEKFHHALSDRARIWESVEWLPEVDDFSNYIINGEIGIEADLSKDKHWTLRSYLLDIYNSVPAAGRKSNDLKLVTALAYKF